MGEMNISDCVQTLRIEEFDQEGARKTTKRGRENETESLKMHTSIGILIAIWVNEATRSKTDCPPNLNLAANC